MLKFISNVDSIKLLIVLIFGIVAQNYIGQPDDDSINMIYLLRQSFVLLATLVIVGEIRNRVLVPYMFVPAVFIGKSYVSEFNRIRNTFNNPRYGNTLSLISIPIEDNVNIDGIEYIDPSMSAFPPNAQKWLIYMNPNAALYEQQVPFLMAYSKEVKMNFLAFNYRGVGRSQGTIKVSDDIVKDGKAAFEYLLKKGVRSENILLHGHSLGGGVATQVRRMFPEGPLIVDRSFRSFYTTAQAIANEIAGLRIMGTFALMFVSCGFVSTFFNHSAGWMLTIALFGGIFGALMSYIIKAPFVHLIGFFIKSLGWTLESIEAWDKIPGEKVIIYHEMDGIIDHETSSLIKALPSKSLSTTHIIELKHSDEGNPGKSQLYHVYGLNEIEDEWKMVTRQAKKMLYGL